MKVIFEFGAWNLWR